MSMPNKVAVASRSFSKHPVLRQEMESKYPAVSFNDAGTSLRGDALIEFLDGHDAAIIALEKIDAGTLDRLPDLRVISKYGVGYDNIDLAALLARDVKFGWTGGVNRRSVSELVICLAITLMRHLPQAQREVADGTWRQLRGRQISDCCFGIVGCGHVGKDLAILLRSFGATVLAHDILDLTAFCGTHGVEAVSLEALLRRSDIVSLHLPFDDSTQNIMGAAQLDLMGPDAFLINTARGGLVDEGALKRQLAQGGIAGAAFDVFATEPPDDEDLLRLPNFVVTPHIGGSSEEAILAMGRAAIAGLAEAAVPTDGQPAC